VNASLPPLYIRMGEMCHWCITYTYHISLFVICICTKIVLYHRTYIILCRYVDTHALPSGLAHQTRYNGKRIPVWGIYTCSKRARCVRLYNIINTVFDCLSIYIIIFYVMYVFYTLGWTTGVTIMLLRTRLYACVLFVVFD